MRRGVRVQPLRLVVAVSLVVLAARCGGDGPITPTPPGPGITCPAAIAISGVAGGSQDVSFPLPTVTGGTQPISIACTRESGSTFTLGATTVTCVAADHIGRQAACSFTVTLNAAALSVKRFLAFGDSFTEGQNGRLDPFGARFVDVPNAYPTKLELLFAAEFPGRGIVVLNRGKGGESVEDGLKRLVSEVLPADRPDALLLLDGYNNLGNPCPFGQPIGSSCGAAIDLVASKLRDAVRAARSFGVQYVFVSTLTPPGPFIAPRDRRISPDAIVEVNARIRPMVPAEGAVLVDPYPLFLGHEAEYVDEDGLHLRPAGYQVLAETFFAAIKAAIPAAFGR